MNAGSIQSMHRGQEGDYLDLQPGGSLRMVSPPPQSWKQAISPGRSCRKGCGGQEVGELCAARSDTLMLFAAAWMELEDNMLSAV